MNNTGKELGWKDYFIIILLIAAGSWFVRGFFFPDPWLADGGAHGIHNLIISGLKVISVLSLFVVLLVYLSVRKGWISASGPIITVATGLLFLILAYPLFTEFISGKTGSLPVSSYHVYLQTPPPVFKPGNPGRNRILALGGSTTAWADSNGRQWTSYLEETLNSSCGQGSVTVYNQGRDWYTTLHSLINYSANLRHAGPQMVLVMHGINDMMHNADFNYLSAGPFRNDYGHYLGPVTGLIKDRTPLETVSYYFHRYWYFKGREAVSDGTFPGLPAFKQNLTTLVDLIRLDGAEPVLMTEPYIYREKMSEAEMRRLDMFRYESVGESKYWTLDQARKGMEEYSDAIRQVAKEKGALLIDLEKMIPKDLNHFVDDVHYTDASYKLVSTGIGQALRQKLQCPMPMVSHTS